MPSFHAGQRLPAGWLNALTSITAEVSGGPTSGDNELQLNGSLVIPAAPIDRLLRASLAIRWATTELNTGFFLQVREGSVNGTQRALSSWREPFTTSTTRPASGPAFLLPAGTPLTLVATARRNTGSGNGSVAGSGAYNNNISVDIFADP